MMLKLGERYHIIRTVYNTIFDEIYSTDSVETTTKLSREEGDKIKNSSSNIISSFYRKRMKLFMGDIDGVWYDPYDFGDLPLPWQITALPKKEL